MRQYLIKSFATQMWVGDTVEFPQAAGANQMWVTDTVEFPHKAGGGGSREISVGVKDSTYPS